MVVKKILFLGGATFIKKCLVFKSPLCVHWVSVKRTSWVFKRFKCPIACPIINRSELYAFYCLMPFDPNYSLKIQFKIVQSAVIQILTIGSNLIRESFTLRTHILVQERLNYGCLKASRGRISLLRTREWESGLVWILNGRKEDGLQMVHILNGI